VDKKDENAKRSADHNFRLCMKYVDEGWKQETLGSNERSHRHPSPADIEAGGLGDASVLKVGDTGKEKEAVAVQTAMTCADGRAK
jgi:hypothetical protein